MKFFLLKSHYFGCYNSEPGPPKVREQMGPGLAFIMFLFFSSFSPALLFLSLSSSADFYALLRGK